jgi:hypothetical protein
MLKENDMVYHGLAGHFLLQGVSHVLKVRIIADIGDRVRLEMQRKNISEKEAYRTLVKDDEERNKWAQFLYGINTTNSQLYDLVIHIRNLSVADAVDIICHTAGMKQFQTTAESQQAMANLALAAEVKAALIDLNPGIDVSAENGKVFVKARISEALGQEMTSVIEDHARAVRGVKDVQIETAPIAFYED